MKWTALLLAAIATFGCKSAGTGSSNIPIRTVAFDNVYGSTTEVPVRVKVDGGNEQVVTATCDVKTCSFKLPLTNARHELEVAVVLQGRQSQSTRISVDTSKLP